MSDQTNIQYECYSCSEKDAEIERLCDIVATQEDALKEFHAEIERLELALIHEEQEAVWGTLEADDE